MQATPNKNMNNTSKVKSSTSFGHLLDGCPLSCNHTLGKLLVGVARHKALGIVVVILRP